MEVFKGNEAAYSWWCAEVISGNGHTYRVRYERYPPGTAAAVERIPRKFIRQWPSPMGDATNAWAPGDVVEAFENYTWSPGVVSTVAVGYLVVRILGSSRDLGVRACELRPRRHWKDDKRILIQKVNQQFFPLVFLFFTCASALDVCISACVLIVIRMMWFPCISLKFMSSYAFTIFLQDSGKYKAKGFRSRNNQLPVENHIDCGDEGSVSRPRIISLPAESCNLAARKRRGIGSSRASAIPRFLDPAASLRTLVREKLVCVNNSIIDQSADMLDFNGDCSSMSSVGSCSP